MGYTCLCIHALKCLLLLPNSMKALLASNSEWKEEKDKKKTDTTERERERVRDSVRERERERESTKRQLLWFTTSQHSNPNTAESFK